MKIKKFIKKHARLLILTKILILLIIFWSLPPIEKEELFASVDTLFLEIDLKESDNARVQRIANDIKRVAGPEVRYVQVEIVYWPGWNAFAGKLSHEEDTAMVVVTKDLLDDVDDDELALVLGHEFSHILLGHIGDTGMDLKAEEDTGLTGDLVDAESRHQEKMSDYLGHYLALKAGYDKCAGVRMWSRLTEVYGDYIYGESHPSLAQRAYYFQKACEGIE